MFLELKISLKLPLFSLLVFPTPSSESIVIHPIQNPPRIAHCVLILSQTPHFRRLLKRAAINQLLKYRLFISVRLSSPEAEFREKMMRS